MSVFSPFKYCSLCTLCVVTFGFAYTPSITWAQSTPIVVDENFASPASEDLSTKDAMNEAGTVDGGTTPSVVSSDIGDGTFFDAENLVPQGEMAGDGPVNVNPVTQPASKYIVVTKNHAANTKVAQIVSAERALSLGRYESALALFDGIYKNNKKDVRVLMGRAVSLQKLGRFDEAMGMYEALSEVDNSNIDVKVNMLGLLGTRYPSIALRRLTDLHKDNQNHVGLTAQIAIAAANTGDSQTALRYLGMAASMEPQNANHIFNMAIISDRAGQTKEAVSYYEKALEVDTIYGAGRSIPRDALYDRLAQIR
ncbi:MAG: tetratricopeptide repeat protein [Alphaproteobacteria bacterium]